MDDLFVSCCVSDFDVELEIVNHDIEIVLDEYRSDKSYTQGHINALERLMPKISGLRKLAKNDNELWVVDFLYNDGLNEITRVKIRRARDIIDNLNGFELVDVLAHLEKAISADPILRGRLD